MAERHDPRYAPPYPQKFHAFWPRHVVKAGILVAFVVAIPVVLAYLLRVPTEFGMTFPDDGMYVPGPEWYFLFLFQPFWHLTGGLRGWLFLGTFVLPLLVLGFLILVPFIFKGEKKRLKKGLVPRLIAASFPVFVFLAIFFGIYRSGAPAKTHGCIACHTPQYGVRQYLPPMDVLEYYRTHRQAQINVGRFRAGKRDEAGEAIVPGETGVYEAESYKDANWQLRHMYEPTFTW